MRSIAIILGGLVLLGLFELTAWRLGGGAEHFVTAMKVFIPIWLAAALVNMWIGVVRAGYSIAEEFPIFLLIFGLPAAVGAIIWWKFS